MVQLFVRVEIYVYVLGPDISELRSILLLESSLQEPILFKLTIYFCGLLPFADKSLLSL